MIIRPNILLVLVGLLLASCNTLESRLPLNRFDQPEALGSNGREIFVQSSRSVDVEHVPDIDEDPPRLNEASLSMDKTAAIGLGLGLLERWDLQLSYKPLFLKTKFQLLGDSRAKAKKNNFSLAVGVGGGVLESVADDVEFDEDSNRGEMDLTMTEASLMAGWRPWDWMMISSSVFAQNINGHGKLKTETGDKYTLRQDGVIKGYSAGLHFYLGRFVISGDYNRSDVAWTNSAKHRSFDSFAGRLALSF